METGVCKVVVRSASLMKEAAPAQRGVETVRALGRGKSFYARNTKPRLSRIRTRMSRDSRIANIHDQALRGREAVANKNTHESRIPNREYSRPGVAWACDPRPYAESDLGLKALGTTSYLQSTRYYLGHHGYAI